MSSFGKINLPDFDGMVKKNKIVGDKVTKIAERCVKAAQGQLYEEFVTGLKRHKRTGKAMKAVKKSIVFVGESMVSGTVGIKRAKGEEGEGFSEAAYQEFGAVRKKDNVVTFKADPWYEPAVKKSRAKLNATYKTIFDREMKK